MPVKNKVAPPIAPSPKRRRSRLSHLRELALIPALIALVIVGALVNPSFLTQSNLVSVLGATAALSLLVLAESLVLVTGRFDLSIESTMGLAPAIGAMLVLPSAAAGFGVEVSAPLAIAAILATGALVGFVNGLLVVRLKLNAFIVTLAMLIVLRGLQVGTTEGKTLFGLPDEFFALATRTVVGVPLSVWLAGLLFLIAGLVLKYHRWGRALYAIGGNADAARAAGIRVDRTRWTVYMIGGTLAAVAGLILTGYVGAISANQGDGLIFTVFAAAVIGGISLDGGKGSMLGALTGVVLLGVVQNILTLAQVPSYWIKAIYGAIILISLVASRITSGKSQE